MFCLLISLPLLAASVGLLFGRILTGNGVCLITCMSSFFCFLVAQCLFIENGLFKSVSCIIGKAWVCSDIFESRWSLEFDSLTVTMCVIVSFVSFLVHCYSVDYMREDPHQPRFMSYLSLFTFFMLILCTAGNFLQIFLGWEGVGLSSYLLINFWFTRLQANKAAIKAMVINRVGDFGLATGLFTVFSSFASIDFFVVFANTEIVDEKVVFFFFVPVSLLNLACLQLFVGAVGKSAQLGLHTWLPDAMEGPTPVSALIHAATMVTAGVYLIARCSPMFEYSTNALSIICFVGGLTAFFAGTTAWLQSDIKKVIAFSTCSQLGYMFCACGLSAYDGAIFHLVNHAFFKALLFLGAGAIIHSLGDEQDLRKMGGLKQLMPLTYIGAVAASLSLAGFPFLSGFYSKDFILETAYAVETPEGHFVHGCGLITAGFTVLYSFQVVYLVYFSGPNGNKPNLSKAHEPRLGMTLAMVALFVPAVISGYILKDLMVGPGTGFWGNSLYINPIHFTGLNFEFVENIVKLLPLMGCLILLKVGISDREKLFTFLINFVVTLFLIDMVFFQRSLISFG